MALAIGMAPIAMQGTTARCRPTSSPLAELIVKEILIGLAFAFAVAVVFDAMSIAGSFLDTLVGFSFGSLVDPITGNQSPVLSQIYALIGVMIFIAIGGDAWMIRGPRRDLRPRAAARVPVDGRARRRRERGVRRHLRRPRSRSPRRC